MNAIARELSSHRPAAAAPAPAQRLDLYGSIHKALRLFMADTLGRLGRLDACNAKERTATLGQLDDLLHLCGQHVRHENEFVHTAIEARQPGTTRQAEAEHHEHLGSIADLAAEAQSLRQSPSALGAQRLYRHTARFVAEQWEHMHLEETLHNAALWSLYDDAELAALHGRLLASIDAGEMMLVLRWMAPALTPQERAELFIGMRQLVPPGGMRDLLHAVQPTLDDAAWAMR